MGLTLRGVNTMYTDYANFYLGFINQFVIAIFMTVLYLNNRKRLPSLRFWTISLYLQSLGHLAAFLCFSFSPPFYIVAYYFFYMGLCTFIGKKVKSTPTIAIVLAISVINQLIYLNELSAYARFVHALTVIALLVILLKELRNAVKKPHWYNHTLNLTQILVVVIIFIFMMRLFMFTRILITKNTFLLSTSFFFPLTHLLYLLALLGLNLSIIFLLNEKMQFDFLTYAKEKKKVVEDLRILASKDFVTQLDNRYSMEDRFNKTLSSVTKESSDYILMVDVDHFKNINDSFGHETGDIVLYQIGVILSRHIKKGEQVGRWGGDEFALTIRCEDTDDLKDRIRSIIEEVRQFDWVEMSKEDSLSVTVSIGVCPITKGFTRREILQKVDNYLYDAKMNGRNQARGPSITII